MPVSNSFDYAVIRVVPRVERGEFLNAGVIVFCLQQRYLAARVQIDEARLRTLWPALDVELIRQHLEAFPKICAGDLAAGPIASLSQRERFHWLVAPRSTMIQVSPVHSGLCDEAGLDSEHKPEKLLDQLFQRLVEL